jgi:hypothetical protein
MRRMSKMDFVEFMLIDVPLVLDDNYKVVFNDERAITECV